MTPIRALTPNRHGALVFYSARAGLVFALPSIRRSGYVETTGLVDCSGLSGARLDSEQRRGLSYLFSVKARNAAEGGACPEHGGGWAWRVGTRSGYGSTGGRGFFGGAGADRGAGALQYRNPHYAKSIFKHLLMGYRAAVRRSFISPYPAGDRR